MLVPDKRLAVGVALPHVTWLCCCEIRARRKKDDRVT
jgi:hypothetical protein